MYVRDAWRHARTRGSKSASGLSRTCSAWAARGAARGGGAARAAVQAVHAVGEGAGRARKHVARARRRRPCHDATGAALSEWSAPLPVTSWVQHATACAAARVSASASVTATAMVTVMVMVMVMECHSVALSYSFYPLFCLSLFPP